MNENLNYQFNKQIFGKAPRSFWSDFYTLLVVFVIAVIAILFAFGCVYTGARVEGASMMPTFNKEHNTHPEKEDVVYYRATDSYDYGDIVVARVQENGVTKDIIKRVVGVGGDIIDIINTRENGYKLEINGKLIEESYLLIDYSLDKNLQNGMETTYVKFHIDLKNNFPDNFNSGGKFVVPEGCIFALGDNRHESQDSTHYGAFELDSVIGKVERVRNSSQSKFGFYYEYIREGKFFETLTNCF